MKTRSPAGINAPFFQHIRQIGRTYHEQCGILFWDLERKLRYVYMAANTDPEPRLHFRMEGADIRMLIRTLAPLVPVGIFHTHVERDNWYPSVRDLEALKKYNDIPGRERWYGVIYHVRTRRVTYYGREGIRSTFVLPD